jgi:hypothetical protein
MLGWRTAIIVGGSLFAASLISSLAIAQTQSDKAVDQVAGAPCPRFGDKPPVGILRDEARAERLGELNWRAAETHSYSVFDQLVTDDGSSPDPATIAHANQLLGRLATALSGYVQAQWALAQLADPTFPPGGVAAHPLRRQVAALSNVEGLFRKYRSNRVADAFVGPIAERFHACLVDLQNQVIVANQDGVRRALIGADAAERQRLMERYAPVSHAFSAPDITTPTVVNELFGNLVDPPALMSAADRARVAANRDTIRRQIATGYMPPKPGRSTAEAPPPRPSEPSPPPSAPSQAVKKPPEPGATAVANNFYRAVRSARQEDIKRELASNVVMSDPKSARTSGAGPVSSRLYQMGRHPQIQIGRLTQHNSAVFEIAISGPGYNGALVFEVSGGKVTIIEAQAR